MAERQKDGGTEISAKPSCRFVEKETFKVEIEQNGIKLFERAANTHTSIMVYISTDRHESRLESKTM